MLSATYSGGQLRGAHGALGDARGDIISALSMVMGRDKAEAWMKSLESLIKQRATEGAEAAIPKIKDEVIKAVIGQTPKIKAEVEKAARGAVMPLIVGSVAVGGLGAFLGIVAIVKSRRK